MRILKPRELEIMRLRAQGQHTKGIARALFLTQRTVNAYTKSACRKLGACNRANGVAMFTGSRWMKG